MGGLLYSDLTATLPLLKQWQDVVGQLASMVSQVVIGDKICAMSRSKTGIEEEEVILHPEGGREERER